MMQIIVLRKSTRPGDAFVKSEVRVAGQGLWRSLLGLGSDT